MMRPYPRCFCLEEAAMLAAALYAQLLTPHIPGPRLPLQARRDLAGRCTALCQAAHIRAYESIVIGEALVSACCGWTGPAEGAADSVAAALVCGAAPAVTGRS
jgi:hypothetical protein